MARLARAALAAFLLSIGAAHAATDCSGTVVVGGTAVQAISATIGPINGYTIANLDTTEALWYRGTGAVAAVATIGSFPLAAGTASTFAGAGVFSTPTTHKPTGGLSVNATTAGHKFSCVWW